MKTSTTFFAGLLLCTSSASYAQSVQDYVAHHRILEAQAAQCNMAMNQHLQQMQYDAWHGRMTGNQGPTCDMPRIISQMAYDETQIHRLTTGDARSSYCQITGVCTPRSYGTESTGGGRTQAGVGQVMRGYETTGQGNERPIGPNGPHHFDCGPGAPDVTGPSWMRPPGCVER